MLESATQSRIVRTVALALAGGLLLAPAFAAEATVAGAQRAIAGAATVIDGDTLDVSGTRIRLEGIDAPETGQTCGHKWIGRWDCGRAATRALASLVEHQAVTCEDRGSDKYGRVLAVCFADGRDINAEMVRGGHAWAFVKYSQSYVDAEAEARALRVGIWEGDAEPAWVYRQKRWAKAEDRAPEGCAIKGNVSDKGHIYHMPWSPWYARVTIDQAKGERWFCSEAEALAAGWRPVALH